MDRLSLVVTSEIKYTEQYCYNKEREKTLSKRLSILFDNKKDNIYTRVHNCMEKVHAYQTIFQSTLNILFEIYSTK